MSSAAFSKLAAGLFVVWVGVATPGCDRPVPKNPDVPVEKLILRPVEDVDDRASRPGELQLLKKVFAPGSEPSPGVLSRFPAYRYNATNVVQNGDSATLTVALTDGKTGNPAGEVQWSVVKVGNAWRIKDAPLPPAAGK
jgi:hypothetical protein